MSDNRFPLQPVLALALIVPISSLGAAWALFAGESSGGLAYLICKLWLLAVPLVWLVKVDRAHLSFSPARQGGFAVAVVLGLLMFALILAAYWFIGKDWIDAEQLAQRLRNTGIDTPVKYLGLAVGISLLNSLMEEYVWRWFVFQKCEQLTPAFGGWVAVILCALLFTIHHVIAVRAYAEWNVTILACSGVFLGGAIWSWLYRRYGSIWPGYVCHLFADVAIYIIGWWILFGGG